MKYDVIVVGLGAMGSAALYQLSKKRLKILGVDKFSPPHEFGSSHGETRLTRQAIGEGAIYTPLALRSNQIWRQLEKESGNKLLHQCGGIIYGDPSSDEIIHDIQSGSFLRDTIKVAQEFNIDHDLLEYSALNKRFPQFKFKKSDLGYVEPGAGYLFPELCIKTQLQLATQRGASILLNNEILAISSTNSSIELETQNQTLMASKVIVCAGAWMPKFLPPKYAGLLKVYRQNFCWFRMAKNAINNDQTPVFMKLPSATEPLIYGFPEVKPGLGVKVASEQFDTTTNPDGYNKNLSSKEISRLHRIASNALDLDPGAVRSQACIYTVSPDSNFIVDYSPVNRNIVLASPCSGHGFKHSSAIGELLTEMTVDCKTVVSELSLARF